MKTIILRILLIGITTGVYAQERKTIDGVEMTFVMEGGDSGIGLWYPSHEVIMTKGKWTNAKRQ